MERLTKRTCGEVAFRECRSACGTCPGVLCGSVFLMVDRLAAYEDTGLTPEEITDLQRAWDMYGGEEGITALLAAPPNDPLTLEELWEMDGEPVWNDTTKKWVLVDLLSDIEPRTVDAQGRWRDLEDRYYRRKPEVRPWEGEST